MKDTLCCMMDPRGRRYVQQFELCIYICEELLFTVLLEYRNFEQNNAYYYRMDVSRSLTLKRLKTRMRLRNVLKPRY